MADKTYELLTLRQDVKGTAGHWQEKTIPPYGNRQGESIVESNTTNTTEPTSIPSPFARMELARTAFTIAAEILGNRNKKWSDVPCRYQKIVSGCLDVAEIFFNLPLYRDYVEIIKWETKMLKNDPMSNTQLGKSMLKFIEGDNSTYNFDKMDAIYLLNYIGENRPNKRGLNIIGATSPITMFFSIDNDLKYVSEKIHFVNGDNPFDGDFNPLEKRDANFIKYLNLYINQSYGKAQFARDFKALSDYIDQACNRLPHGIDIDGTYDYEKIEVLPNSGNYVQVLGKFLGCQAERQPQKSDFEVKSSIVPQERLPLILPVEIANAYSECAYISKGDLWGQKQAPAREMLGLDERVLPGTNVKYPYLTISDFFEDVIVKMPFKLNSVSYFNGNLEKESEDSYLLPLKPLFFKYFTVDELRNMISMKVSSTVVEVKLNIPIHNYSGAAAINYVTYQKIYQTNRNDNTNVGGTEIAKFGLGVFPIVRSNDVNVAHYRIALFDKVKDIDLKFYNKVDSVSENYSNVLREYRDVCGIKSYVISKQNFDRIDVSVGGNHGYVIPNFEDSEGTGKFRFAVDFGTTNTHIAYSVSNQREASAFECIKPQIARLHDNYKAERDIIAAFEDNFVPNTKLEFPIRSAFAESQRIDYGQITYTLCDGNIPFRYEKVGPQDYQNIQTGEDLKWSVNRGRIELYIKNIAYILRNKVLMDKGSLKDTEIRWFYPASMSTFVRNMMEQAWIMAYKEYFDADYDESSNKVTRMSESIAPYCHYINKAAAVGIVTTIDVGGGTTDVYVSDGKVNPDGSTNHGILLSFRCASNAIFGDGYNNNISNNGFVKEFKPIFEKELSDNDTLKNAMSTIALKGNSSELISFFFSLASSGKPGLNFMQKLAEDQRFKYVFLIFYSAIVYHVAQTMKAKGIGMPQTVAFSGNGSRSLQVISQNHAIQEEFVKTIFEKVYGEVYPKSQKFTLKFDNDKPKEATANGGLEATMEQVQYTPELVVLLGKDDHSLADGEAFDKLSDSFKNEVVKSVVDFIDFIPSLNNNNAFGDKYSLDVSILDEVLELCKQDLDNYLDLGLQKVLQILAADPTMTNKVTESLFFFPIVGMLNNLAQEIKNL